MSHSTGERLPGHNIHNIRSRAWVPELQRGSQKRTTEDGTFCDRPLSQVVACRTGRMVADKLPGAAMAVAMVETFVPRGVKKCFKFS